MMELVSRAPENVNIDQSYFIDRALEAHCIYIDKSEYIRHKLNYPIPGNNEELWSFTALRSIILADTSK